MEDAPRSVRMECWHGGTLKMEWQELEPGDGTRSAEPADFQWAELPVARPASEASAFLRDCELLGVGPAFTMEEIHAAYRSLVLQHHPDRARDIDRPRAEERLKAINAAYSHLQRTVRMEKL